MKNLSAFSFQLSALLLLSAAAMLTAQQMPTPDQQDLINQYQSNPSAASSDRMQKLLDEYFKLKNGQTAQKDEAESRATDTANSVRVLPPPVVEIGSMYENILRNITTHPDSQLAKLSIFGYDVFSQSKSPTFAPSEADLVMVPADYPVNAGDEIIITVWGRINDEFRLTVLRNGTITIPRIGPVPVAGLPYEAVQKNILGHIESIEGVHASVTMGKLRSLGIFIVGEVTAPGFYTVTSLSSVTNALFAAGGPSKRGSLRNIQLKRNGQLVAAIDYYDFLLAGSDRSSLRLQSGDVIYVPIVQNMAAIAGNVRRSGLYELKGKTQLEDLIKLAGGLAPTAWTNRIQVERYVKNQFRGVLDVESTKESIPRFEILDGDIVKIYPVLIKDKNAVYLSGNVLRPGKYEFREGMRITDLIPNYQALLAETYFTYGIVLRQNPITLLAQIIPFNLQSALDTPSSVNNLPLQAKDEVVIYNKNFFEPNRTVSIEGAVNKPGTLKLLDSMKIKDLILQAGGLREDASPTRGELYRREILGQEVSTKKIDFCVECALQDDSAHNLALKRQDRVFIRQKLGWEVERKVTLRGELVYPGTYVIFEGESLGNLIKRAGGFKDSAYLAASVFTRTSTRALEEQRKKEYLQQQDIYAINLSSELVAADKKEDAKTLLSRQAALKDILGRISSPGRIILDLTKPGQYEGFTLENNDTLYVPKKTSTVAVVGEVFNPATFVLNSEKNSPWNYIEAAGGMKETADKSHVYVIKANGSIITGKMQSLSSIELQPGDAVVVPQKIRFSNAHRIFVDTMDALFKMATVLVLIITVVTTLHK